jgi:hypothetical protein
MTSFTSFRGGIHAAQANLADLLQLYQDARHSREQRKAAELRVVVGCLVQSIIKLSDECRALRLWIPPLVDSAVLPEFPAV